MAYVLLNGRKADVLAVGEAILPTGQLDEQQDNEQTKTLKPLREGKQQTKPPHEGKHGKQQIKRLPGARDEQHKKMRDGRAELVDHAPGKIDAVLKKQGYHVGPVHPPIAQALTLGTMTQIRADGSIRQSHGGNRAG